MTLIMTPWVWILSQSQNNKYVKCHIGNLLRFGLWCKANSYKISLKPSFTWTWRKGGPADILAFSSCGRGNEVNPLSANITKWLKHTETIRLQIADELFECVWPFRGIGA